MKAIITGAGGFIGQELVKQLEMHGDNELTLFDSHFPDNTYYQQSKFDCIEGSFVDKNVRAKLLDREFDVLFHLAALPGGAAEKHPQLSKKVNLDATLALIEEAGRVVKRPRVVYSSTIAVLPIPMPTSVDDNCPLCPELTYGTHKAMVELALADMSRKGIIDSVALRLPGIVARPPVSNGLKSAFLSDVFHALKAGNPFESPVSEKASMWLMSVNQCAQNLLHAAKLDSISMPKSRCVNLPVVRATMAELVKSIADEVKQPPSLVSYNENQELERVFGSQSLLKTTAAGLAGFKSDETLKKLVRRALNQ